MDDATIRIELARLDERQKAAQRELERSETVHSEALKIRSAELARRLDTLNHAHSEAIRVQGTYIPREMYERDRKEDDKRLRAMENAMQNLLGKLWLPLIVVAAASASIAAVAVGFIMRTH
jgi:hypothetical protein